MVELIEETDYGTPIFELAIYESEDLFFRNGDTPAETVAGYFTRALNALRIDHRIYFEFAAVPIDSVDMSCSQDRTTAYDLWGDYLRNEAHFVAADSNIMLADTHGAGCGAIGGNVCVAGNTDVDQEYTQPYSEEPWSGQVNAALHEIGHNMDFQHGGDPDKSGRYRYHPGNTFMEGGKWNRTPNVGNDVDTQNLCGKSIDPKESSQVVNWLHYNDCVAEWIKNVDLPPIITVAELDADTDMVVGETAIIDVHLTNRTPVDERATVEVTATKPNQQTVHIHTIDEDVLAVGSHFADMSWVPPETGEWTITAGDAEIERTVAQSGSVEITSLSIDPASPRVDEAATIAATLTNTTPESVSREFDVIADEGANRPEHDIGTLDFSVGAGDSDTETLVWRPEEATDYTIEVGDASIDVSVRDPAEGEVSVQSISVPGDPRVGMGAQIVLKARNDGGQPVEESVTVTADPGGTIGTVTFDLDPGQTAFKNLTWTPSAEGQTTLSAGSAQTVVTVEPGAGGEPPEQPGVDLRPALPGLASAGLFLVAKPEWIPDR